MSWENFITLCSSGLEDSSSSAKTTPMAMKLTTSMVKPGEEMPRLRTAALAKVFLILDIHTDRCQLFY